MDYHTILTMAIFMCLSWSLIRFAAPYQKDIAQKYIVLPSAFLAKCLIPKQRGYVKVADRRKISLFSFVFYGLFAAVSIVLLLCFLLPEVPCEVFVAYYGRKSKHAYYEIYTWNEKLVYFLPMMLAFTCIMLPTAVAVYKIAKRDKLTVKALLGLCLLPMFFLGLLIALVIWVF